MRVLLAVLIALAWRASVLWRRASARFDHELRMAWSHMDVWGEL